MSQPKQTRHTKRLEEGAGRGERFVDLGVELRVEKTNELILRVGGKWDRKQRAYVGNADEYVRLYLVPSQIEAARWFKRWLKGYLTGVHDPDTDRIWAVLFAGGRRGGKSDLAMKCVLCFLVAVAGDADRNAIVWAISPVLERTQELQDVIEKSIPSRWYTFNKDLTRYTLLNGSRLWMLSGFKPSGLKRGRVDLVLINEAQEFSEAVYAKVRPATSDTGGLTILTANPPEMAVGQWTLDFYEEAKAGKRQARLFEFDPRLNPYAVTQSLEDMKSEVDERTYRREILGEWLPIGDKVFYSWSPKYNILSIPEGLRDVTEAFTRRHLGRSFPDIVGADFQLTPHMAAVRYRAYEGFGGTEVDPILWIVGYFKLDQANEHDLIDAMEEVGLTGEGTCVIADASGEWQDAERTKGRGSYDMFRSRRWRYIYTPDPNAKRNPRVEERVAVANARFCDAADVRHVYSEPENVDLNRAIRDWENRNGRPYQRSVYAHLCDAVSYPLYRFYPRKAPTPPFTYSKVPRPPRRSEMKGFV